MKIFAVYIIDKDNFGGECKVKANNKTEAIKQVKQYIKAWNLAPAKIEYCKEITEYHDVKPVY